MYFILPAVIAYQFNIKTDNKNDKINYHYRLTINEVRTIHVVTFVIKYLSSILVNVKLGA